MNKIITLTILILLLIGCGGPNEATKVGNPDTSLPAPTKAFTAKYIIAHPYWLGSTDSEVASDPNLYLIEFDAENNITKISSTKNPEPIEVRYNILDNGSIVTTDPASPLKINGIFRPNSTLYPIAISIIDEESALVAETFASSDNNKEAFDDFFNPQLMCEVDEVKCFDSDGSLLADGQYHVSGFIQTHKKDANNCELVIHDTCKTEGELLAEAVCVQAPRDGYNYEIRYIECNCQNGRCVDEPNDTPLAKADEPWWGDFEVKEVGVGSSRYPSISDDGRYVAFDSTSTNLTEIPLAGKSGSEIYVRDLKARTTTLITINPDIMEPYPISYKLKPYIMGSGQKVMFSFLGYAHFAADYPDPKDFVPELVDIFLSDLQTGETKIIDEFTKEWSWLGITFTSGKDERYITYLDDNQDMIVLDLQTGTTRNLTKTLIRDQGGHISEPRISGNGKFVVFAGHLNEHWEVPAQIYLLNVETKAIQCISVSSSEEVGNGWNTGMISINESGQFVTFRSSASNLVPGVSGLQVYVRDRINETTELVSVPINGNINRNGHFSGTSISDDGRFVVFASDIDNLVQNDTNEKSDIFLRDLRENKTIRISISAEGEEATGSSIYPDISGNGRYVAFMSYASNLVPATNINSENVSGLAKVFVYDLKTGKITVASVPNDN